jgi:hypothetical protein
LLGDPDALKSVLIRGLGFAGFLAHAGRLPVPEGRRIPGD